MPRRHKPRQVLPAIEAPRLDPVLEDIPQLVDVSGAGTVQFTIPYAPRHGKSEMAAAWMASNLPRLYVHDGKLLFRGALGQETVIDE